MLTAEQAIAEMLAALDRKLRPVSLAEFNKESVHYDEVTSRFGGAFVGLPDEGWPETESGLMIPLLQVRTDELPNRPKALEKIALLNVFVDANDLPMEFPAESGDRWLLRAYRTMKGLVPLDNPEEDYDIRPAGITWRAGADEGPTWDDAIELYDITGFPDEESVLDETKQVEKRYRRQAGTKVGGYPSYVQGGIGMAKEYVFQIASVPEWGWSWGDVGTGYFYCEKGRWYLHWDCY